MVSQKWIRKNDGIALPVVMVLLFIMILLCTILVFVSNNETKTVSIIKSGESAIHLAEAGFNQYLWYMNDDSKFYETEKSNSMLNKDIKYENGYYRLSIRKPDQSDPDITVISTGWLANSPDVKKTIEVKIKKRQFVQKIYVSNSELDDNGEIVWWFTGDNITGPLHTNGNINIAGNPVFNGYVTFTGKVNLKSNTTNRPVYNGGGPDKVAALKFPEVNQDLIKWAKKDSYYYTGRTSILLRNNKLLIRNVNIDSNALKTLDLPPNGVIYVDGTNSNNTFDASGGNVFVSGTLDGKLTIAAYNNIYITGKDPTNYDYKNAAVTGGINYSNSNISGPSISDDMLGLVANQYVKILHFGWFGSSNGNVSLDSITIQAAIFAKNKSFEFDQYDSYNDNVKKDILFLGSITQQFRGAVGMSSGSTRTLGYAKKYVYDTRMEYDYPPHFVEPKNAGWEVMGWRQIATP